MLPSPVSEHRDRQVLVDVPVAVAQAASVHRQAVVQQRAVAIRRSFELGQELRVEPETRQLVLAGRPGRGQVRSAGALPAAQVRLSRPDSCLTCSVTQSVQIASSARHISGAPSRTALTKFSTAG